MVEQLRQPVGDGDQRVLEVAGALGAAEVRGDHDARGAFLKDLFDRRKRLTDAEVVDDLAVVDGDVEVRAEQDLLVLDVDVVERLQLHTACSLTVGCARGANRQPYRKRDGPRARLSWMKGRVRWRSSRSDSRST